MIEIQFDDREIIAALQRLAAQTSDLRPALEEIGAHIEASTKLNFSGQHDPFGNAWPSLSDVTLARRRKKGKGAQILRDTGRLMNSINHQVNSNSVEIGPDEVVYAAMQQFGAKQGAFGRNKRGAPIPWGDVPPRPFMGVSDDDQDEILAIITQHIEQALR
jgi:phage virion morphogenesis protein